MDTNFPVKLSVTLSPVGTPNVKLKVKDQITDALLLTQTTFDFQFDADSPAYFQIEHYGKKDKDPITAVKIDSIAFFGISDPKFIWAGTYYPSYPSHYVDGASAITNTTYMGWNGIYVLEFTVPVFTWMHKLQGLGLIYY